MSSRRGPRPTYTFLYRNMSSGLMRPPHLPHQVQDLPRGVDAADGHLLVQRVADELLHRCTVERIEPGRPEERARTVDRLLDVGLQRDAFQHAPRIHAVPEEHHVVLP